MTDTRILSKSQRNKEHKKNSLLQAAYSLMTRHDMSDVSISDITTQAGVAKGTFYLFFKDKNDIRDFLIARESENILRKAQSALDATDIRGFEDAILFMISHILSQLIENPLLLRLIRRNLSFGLFHRHLQSTLEEDGFDLFSRFSQKAEAAGIHYEDPRMIFFMIIELTGSVCYSSIVNELPAPIDQVRPSLFEAIRAILKSGKRKPESAHA